MLFSARRPTSLLNDQKDARKNSKHLLPRLLDAAQSSVGPGEFSSKYIIHSNVIIALE